MTDLQGILQEILQDLKEKMWEDTNVFEKLFYIQISKILVKWL